MSDQQKVNESELEGVSGGMSCIVNTGDYRDAAIRNAPGLNTTVIATLPNGTVANTTGVFVQADGRNWAEIDYPVRGWIKGSILGFAY